MKRARILFCVLFLVIVSCVPAFAYDDDQVLGQSESVMAAVSEPSVKCAETPLGDLTADAVREIAGTELAVVPGGAFAANLDAGAITWSELRAIFPSDKPIVTTRITPSELYAMLEQSVGRITLSEDEYIDYGASEYDGFLQISGFRFRYDVSSVAGERISEVSISDGQALERGMDTPTLTIAFPQSLLDEYNALRPLELTDTGLTVAEVMAEYVQNAGTVSAPESGRMEAFGSNDNAIIRRFPLAALVIGVVLFVFAGLSKSRGRSLPRGMGKYDGIES